jgi:hypothetical protein
MRTKCVYCEIKHEDSYECPIAKSFLQPQVKHERKLKREEQDIIVIDDEDNVFVPSIKRRPQPQSPVQVQPQLQPPVQPQPPVQVQVQPQLQSPVQVHVHVNHPIFQPQDDNEKICQHLVDFNALVADTMLSHLRCVGKSLSVADVSRLMSQAKQHALLQRPDLAPTLALLQIDPAVLVHFPALFRILQDFSRSVHTCLEQLLNPRVFTALVVHTSRSVGGILAIE